MVVFRFKNNMFCYTTLNLVFCRGSFSQLFCKILSLLKLLSLMNELFKKYQYCNRDNADCKRIYDNQLK